MDDQLGDITGASSNRKCSANNGSIRRLKDNAADWFNLMLRWNKLNEEGFGLATDIVNTRRSESDRRLVIHSSSSSSSSSSSPRGSAEWPPAELQDNCRRLQDIVEKMVAVLKKMERLMTSQRGVVNLQEFQCGPKGPALPLFHSWATREFEEAAATIFGGFCQEMKLKQLILEEVAHTSTPDLCVVYLSCWLHQPFIPDQNRRTLEAMLLETGHRPL